MKYLNLTVWMISCLCGLGLLMENYLLQIHRYNYIRSLLWIWFFSCVWKLNKWVNRCGLSHRHTYVRLCEWEHSHRRTYLMTSIRWRVVMFVACLLSDKFRRIHHLCDESEEITIGTRAVRKRNLKSALSYREMGRLLLF